MQNPPPRLRRAAAAAVADGGTALLSSDFQDLPATLAWPLDPPLQVVLPCVDVGRQTICMMVQTAGQAMLGLVQMCGWDAISPQWQPAAGGANLPVVIWTCSGTIPATPGGIYGAQPWTISGSDQFLAADVDGDGIQEIIAVQNGNLAVLKWAGNALYVLWSGSTVPGTGGAGTWTPQQSDSYVAAALGAGYNNGQDALFVWNGSNMALLEWSSTAMQTLWSGNQVAAVPGCTNWAMGTGNGALAIDLVGDGVDSLLLWCDGMLGVVQWSVDANALSLVWDAILNYGDPMSTGPLWPLGGGDQHVAVALGGGESVYQESLVLFNPGTLMAGVAQWDPEQSQLQLLWTSGNTGTIPGGASGGPAVALTSDTTAMVASLLPNAPFLLFVQPGGIACLEWDGTQLGGTWAQQHSYPGMGGAQSWVCNNDQYFVAGGAAGMLQQLLVCANNGEDYGLLVYNGSNGMDCCWQGVQDGFPGWGLPLIAAAPQTAYPPLGAPGSAQAQLYATVSSAVCGSSDLRPFYTQTNSVQLVQQWLGALQNLPPPTVPAPADWTAICGALATELQDLQAVYQLYANFTALAAAIGTQMDNDLAEVIGFVSPPSSAPQVSFSLANLVGSLSGACTPLCARNPAQGNALALLVPLLPAAVLQNVQSPQQMAYGSIKALVDGAFNSPAFQNLNGLGQNQIAGDSVKCAMVAALMQQPWAWPTPASSTDDVVADIAVATQATNRVQFYATIVPCTYTIYYEQTSGQRLDGVRWNRTPPWAAWSTTLGGQPWCYTLATDDDLGPGFPSQGMMQDMTTIAQAADVFLGNGPWAAIARVAY